MVFLRQHSVQLIVGSLLLLLFIGIGGYVWLNKSQPEGYRSPKADTLAHRMLNAINFKAWDTTRYVQWTFNDHDYLWDKQRQIVRVEWKDRSVLLDLSKGPVGIVYEEGQKVTDSSRQQKLLKKAWSLYCNDSFWLNAPAKVFDPGTIRKLVPQNGDTALLVTYTKGGVTPGDTYLWHLNDNGRPKSYQMWVSILPVGGMEVSWEGWETVSTGARVATRHKGGPITIKIENLKAGMNLKEFGLEQDPFRVIFNH